ncbi:hypothetical protein [uncultured Methylophaga sp.]|uniref:hypothetical protein n=1 Tax=uncultured Methylophaga sp. TaxID=285271 RepID=UPI002615862C|nr:hypothetical protein [uncultured Methylophaga sp.]
MKFVKGLLIFVMTLFAIVIALATYSSSTSLIPLAFIAIIYFSLVYLVWPIGTPYSKQAYVRLFIVLGMGMFLLAIEVLLGETCPVSSFAVIYPSYKIAMFDSIIGLLCEYLGKFYTATFILGFGCYILYLGYSKNLTINSKRTAVSRQTLN